METMLRNTLIVLLTSVFSTGVWANIPVVEVAKQNQDEEAGGLFSVAVRDGGATYKPSVVLRPAALFDVCVILRNVKGYQFVRGDLRLKDTNGQNVLVVTVTLLAGEKDADGTPFAFTVREDFLRGANISLEYRAPTKANPLPYGDRIVYDIDLNSYLTEDESSNKPSTPRARS